MLKVFLVEDETIIREGLRDIIPWQQYGYILVGDAGDGEQALPMIRETRPDVLITDIKMPFMDGLALSSLVNKELPGTKIIIISGYDDFEYARQAIRIGVDPRCDDALFFRCAGISDVPLESHDVCGAAQGRTGKNGYTPAALH